MINLCFRRRYPLISYLTVPVYFPPLSQVGTDDTTIYMLNTDTGVVTSAPNAFSNGHDIISMDYDPVSGAVFGIGQMVNKSDDKWVRTVAKLDCATGNVTIQGVVPGYTMQYGGVATLNVADRALYYIGLPNNYTTGG